MAEAVLFSLRGIIEGSVVAPIRQQFSYMFCFDSNIHQLEARLDDLQTTREMVQEGVDDGLRNVRVIGPNVQTWLKRADEVTSEIEAIIQYKSKVQEGCLNGWCPNLKLRYSMSRKAVKKTNVVAELQAAGVLFTKSSYSPPPPSTVTIPNRDIPRLASQWLTMEEIIMALKHDDMNLVGICGMGGIGKTTIAKEVAKRAREDDLFDEIVMAVVSQQPNLTNVQACIADMLGLKLGDGDSLNLRTDLLRTRLMQGNKKILILLDDIWAEFDLQKVGIPLGGANNNLKVLYTSRNRGLWRDLETKMEILIQFLTKDEAWQLFRENVGDSADSPDLQPIAREIVNACGGVPLALLLIGRKLSGKGGRGLTVEIWTDMLEKLTSSRSTLPDDLSSALEQSCNNLQDAEAKHLFSLCCLFKGNENIHIEILARYGLGLSLFEGIFDLRQVRRRVFSLVNDLKCQNLLLDGEYNGSVKVNTLVRTMGISILSRDRGALVSHDAEFDWPKDRYEHYAFISVIAREITALPEELTCRNLEFLVLQFSNPKKLPCNFFVGLEKCKVLELNNFGGILTLQSLKNLTTLSLEGFNGVLDNASEVGGLINLEILSFCGSLIDKLPEEIGELVMLRLLDLSRTRSLRIIPPGILSRLIRLEELYIMDSRFMDWEGEDEEEGGRNANLREFESLSSLNTLEIVISEDVLIPKVPIFSKLEIYRILIVSHPRNTSVPSYGQYKKRLIVSSFTATPSDRGGIDLLLSGTDCLYLYGEGCNDTERELLLRERIDGLQQLKRLEISDCDCDTPECLINTMDPVQQPDAAANATAVFPIVAELKPFRLDNLREICRSPVSTVTFEKLTSIYVGSLGRSGNLFQLPMVGCLTQLKRLTIWKCDMMKEVIQKEQQEDVHVSTDTIEFPKLETLELMELPSLLGFCKGIDQINFPQLKRLYLKDLGKFNCLFHRKNNLSCNAEQNDDVGFLSFFPQKAAFPRLETLELEGLQDMGDIWGSDFLIRPLAKLKCLKVKRCASLRNTFHPSMAEVLVNLQELIINDCSMMEAVVDREEKVENEQGRKTEKTVFPHLSKLELHCLPILKRFCHFTHPIKLPLLSQMVIEVCPRLNSFSSGSVSFPNLFSRDISYDFEGDDTTVTPQKIESIGGR